MALQITGSFKSGYASYTDPQLQLIPHLTYRGTIAMDVNVTIPTYVTDSLGTGSMSYPQVETIPMYPSTSELTYPKTKVDPYSDLIYSLETYIITQLSGSNPNCTFNRV
jgi:hypothetical protein